MIIGISYTTGLGHKSESYKNDSHKTEGEKNDILGCRYFVLFAVGLVSVGLVSFGLVPGSSIQHQKIKIQSTYDFI